MMVDDKSPSENALRNDIVGGESQLPISGYLNSNRNSNPFRLNLFPFIQHRHFGMDHLYQSPTTPYTTARDHPVQFLFIHPLSTTVRPFIDMVVFLMLIFHRLHLTSGSGPHLVFPASLTL